MSADGDGYDGHVLVHPKDPGLHDGFDRDFLIMLNGFRQLIRAPTFGIMTHCRISTCGLGNSGFFLDIDRFWSIKGDKAARARRQPDDEKPPDHIARAYDFKRHRTDGEAGCRNRLNGPRCRSTPRG